MFKEIHPRTQQINSDQQAKARKACLDTLKWLAEEFPNTFNTELKVRPLKIGIVNDLIAYIDKHHIKTISRSKLRKALVVFTRRMEYLVCLKHQEFRVDLEGNEVAQVTKEEASQAQEKIRSHVEKNIRGKQQVKRHCAISSSHEFPVIKEFKSTTEVLVRKKVAKRYDPEAVARLKEKLRLAKTASL